MKKLDREFKEAWNRYSGWFLRGACVDSQSHIEKYRDSPGLMWRYANPVQRLWALSSLNGKERISREVVNRFGNVAFDRAFNDSIRNPELERFTKDRLPSWDTVKQMFLSWGTRQEDIGIFSTKA